MDEVIGDIYVVSDNGVYKKESETLENFITMFGQGFDAKRFKDMDLLSSFEKISLDEGDNDDDGDDNDDNEDDERDSDYSSDSNNDKDDNDGDQVDIDDAFSSKKGDESDDERQ